MRVIEHTETTAMDRFRAAGMGMPFLPTKSGIGIDPPTVNDSLLPVTDPFTGEAWLAVRAIRPDVAIIHIHTADVWGNVQLDPERWHDNSPDVMIARSARIAIVSVEQIVSDAAVLGRPIDTILPRVDVTCAVEAPFGAHPCRCDACYDYDLEALGDYQRRSDTAAHFAGWLDEFVDRPVDHAAHLDRIGTRRLSQITRHRSVR